MRRRRSIPGAAAHIGCALLALVMTLTTALCCLTGGSVWAVSDRGLMLRAANAVLDVQAAKLEETVREKAEAYSFNPLPVLALTDREAAAQYNSDLVDWWMALLRDPAVLAVPQWSCPQIAETVMADEKYQDVVRATQRRTIAVDQVQRAVERTMNRSALPLRSSLMQAGLTMVGQKLPLRVAMTLARMLPALLAMTAALLALGMLACMRREMSCALPYIGAGLAAGGLVSAAVLVLVNSLDVVGQTSIVSATLPAQSGVLAFGMGLRIGVLTGACILIGLGLIALFQRPVKK